jgi:hypothetical protein
MPRGYFEETRAIARLPNLDIEIVHGREADGGAEHISIKPAGGALFRGLRPRIGGRKSDSVLDALRPVGLGALARHRRRQSAAGKCQPPSGTAAKRRTSFIPTS